MIYLDFMEKQYRFYTAVQEGNFNGKMCAWEFFWPFYFSTLTSTIMTDMAAGMYIR